MGQIIYIPDNSGGGGGAVNGATNGISIYNGDQVGLGGALTQDTIINDPSDGNRGLNFGYAPGVNLKNFDVGSRQINFIGFDSGGFPTGSVIINDSVTSVGANSSASLILENTNFNLSLGVNNAVFSDQTAGTAGIEYAADYSASFTPRSLVDKEYVDNNSGASSLVISATPPGDTSLLWFKTGDSEIYFYDGSGCVTSQVYEFFFNDQGTTPNNTWFRMGNTVSGDSGIGFHLDYDVKITGLSFNRAPNTAQVGWYDLYSNTLNIGSNTAALVGSYLTDGSARGLIEFPDQSPTSLLELNGGSYMSLRWRGNQTNNNLINVQYRKKHV